MIDASVGGASFFLGALTGLVVGGLVGYAGWGQLAKTTVVGQTLGGMSLQIGPITRAQFYWIVLDRALLHHRLVCSWVHGRRGAPLVSADQGKVGIVDRLTKERRTAIARALGKLGVDRAGGERDLAEELRRVMAEADGP